MDWKKKCLRDFKLYAVTDLKDDDSGIVEKIDRILRGGVDIVQLRSKSLSDQALFRLGTQIRALTLKLKKLFIVNDRVDLMLATQADGVHLGQDDLPLAAARRLCRGQSRIIGQSTHSLDQAIQGEHSGADYIAYGPIFGTPTKPTYQPVGLENIRRVVQSVNVPVVCIGGIDTENIEKLTKAGANRVAVVRAVFDDRDPFRAASRLKRALTQ